MLIFDQFYQTRHYLEFIFLSVEWGLCVSDRHSQQAIGVLFFVFLCLGQDQCTINGQYLTKHILLLLSRWISLEEFALNIREKCRVFFSIV